MSADIPGGAAAGASGNLSPGDHLRAEIERLGLDQIAVGKAAGVSRQTVNNIVNGRQRISRAMAARLGRLTGHSSDYWLRDVFPRRKSARPDTRERGASGVLVNHQILRAVKEGAVLIEPFAQANLRAASVELTLDAVLVTGRGERIDIGRRRNFVLNAGQAAQVSTKEHIALARDYLGRVGTSPRVARAGIVASLPLQIEPGFNGRLRFSVFNCGGAPLRLRAGEPVLYLEIVRLAAAPE